MKIVLTSQSLYKGLTLGITHQGFPVSYFETSIIITGFGCLCLLGITHNELQHCLGDYPLFLLLGCGCSDIHLC